MKKWNYSLTTSVIWASFDNGTVEAKTEEEARTKALAQLTYDLQKVNTVLKHCDITTGFDIEMNFDCLEIEEIKEKGTSRFIVEHINVAQINEDSLPYVGIELAMQGREIFVDVQTNGETLYNGTIFQELLDEDNAKSDTDQSRVPNKVIPILKELAKDCETYDYVQIIK